ncbi:ATP-binding protein [Trebonia sp.]|uniref:ATP-binding protein n=1 Tax=Trebonia sp. TaxID=2767075 RepID=UPI002637C671|nr:ATP-binding protein [Trebonia sp.]
MATVEVTFTPLPAHVRTARLVATAVARRSGVDESLLDEVRLAVGEACSRAVEAHQRHCPGQPIRVALTDDGERFEVVVTDSVPADVTLTDVAPARAAASDERTGGTPAGERSGRGVVAVAAPAGGNGTAPGAVPGPQAGGGSDSPLAQLPAGVGLAVISGLADDFRISPAGGGTSVAMSWKRRSDSG